MKPRALITGIAGQDGSYLAEMLLDLGYEVHGIVRRVALEDSDHRLWRLRDILSQLELHSGSVESEASLFRVLSRVQPAEIYHLAAVSFVGDQFEDEAANLAANIRGIHSLLAAARELTPEARVFFAASSEMFGAVPVVPQSEATPHMPSSAYGISKLAGYHLVRNYRDRHQMFAASGILYNHESPRRGFEFVTRKISNGAARIRLGQTSELRLGNLDARRDWGHARDYVRAMWMMLQNDRPEDFVIATGELRSVRDFVDVAFRHVGLDYREFVRSDPAFMRTDAGTLTGDSSKARDMLKWKPAIEFTDLVAEMVEHDLRLLQAHPTIQTF